MLIPQFKKERLGGNRYCFLSFYGLLIVSCPVCLYKKSARNGNENEEKVPKISVKIVGLMRHLKI